MNPRGMIWIPFAFLSLLLFTSCGQSQGSDREIEGAAVAVETFTVQPVVEPQRLEMAGEVVSRNRVEVSSKVSGRVAGIPVTEGTRVKRGELVLRLDAPELVFALAQAEAAEKAARLHQETASRQAERFRRLAAGEVVTPRDLEMALVAEAAAEAEYEQARAASEMHRRNLSYAELRAPREGRVVKRLVREGDLAVPGKPLLVLEDDLDPEVRVTLPAGLGWPIGPGSPAEIVFQSKGMEPLPAVVDRMTPTADNHTRELYLRAEGLSAPGGTFVQAVFLGEPRESIRVPEEALVERGALTGVYVVQEGRAVLRWLRLTSDGTVAAGLAPGEVVILAPPASLGNGTLVEVAS